MLAVPLLHRRYSTPQRLYVVVNETVKAFDAMQAQATQAMKQDAVSEPRKVRILRDIRNEIVRKYL